jgi:inorganic pyrophosphatase
MNVGSDVPNKVNVIVEIPKGSQNKYEFDEKLHVFKLDRVLFSPFHYPGDYGIIPETLADDGDLLDALVLVTNPTYPGILIEARPIGLLELNDSGKLDDKILCVPHNDPRFAKTKDIDDVDSHVLKEIAHFFEVYKGLEGKKVEVLGWKGVREARKAILKAVKLYRKSVRGK